MGRLPRRFHVLPVAARELVEVVARIDAEVHIGLHHGAMGSERCCCLLSSQSRSGLGSRACWVFQIIRVDRSLAALLYYIIQTACVPCESDQYALNLELLSTAPIHAAGSLHPDLRDFE